MTKTIATVLAGAVLLLAWRWFYVWRQSKMEAAAFEYRIRNRQDLHR